MHLSTLVGGLAALSGMASATPEPHREPYREPHREPHHRVGSFYPEPTGEAAVGRVVAAPIIVKPSPLPDIRPVGPLPSVIPGLTRLRPPPPPPTVYHGPRGRGDDGHHARPVTPVADVVDDVLRAASPWYDDTKPTPVAVPISAGLRK